MVLDFTLPIVTVELVIKSCGIKRIGIKKATVLEWFQKLVVVDFTLPLVGKSL